LGTHTGWNLYAAGYTPKADEPKDSLSVGFISPGYLETMNIPLLAGRDFDEHDIVARRDVLIVNETFARHYFDGRNPLDKGSVSQRARSTTKLSAWRRTVSIPACANRPPS